jgi:aminopeptidase I
MMAFQISDDYRAPQPFTISAAHIDALCMKVKPYSKLGDKGGWDRIGVAPYAGGGASQSWDGSFSTWWDRDLGCAGRVLIKGDNGKVVEKLVQLPGAGIILALP